LPEADRSEIAIKTALGRLKGRGEPAQTRLFAPTDDILCLAHDDKAFRLEGSRARRTTGRRLRWGFAGSPDRFRFDKMSYKHVSQSCLTT